MIISPRSRSIVRRNSSGFEAIPISATYQGSPDRIEARAVEMNEGAHSGASIGWEMTATMPVGEPYAGTLVEVAASGWYQIEVRSVTGGVAAEAEVVKRAAIGIVPRECDFEDSQSAEITRPALLADGVGQVMDISKDNDLPLALEWRILTADGQHAASGENGYFSPAADNDAAAIDRVNEGILLGIAGRHVAVLAGGAEGNHYLNTTRCNAAANTVHTLTVAIGVRDDPASFGGVRLDILAGGQVVSTASYTKTALDGLKGSNAAGGFTDVSLVYETGESVAANQRLAIRIAKTGGEGTVLDFDNVRFTSAESGYSQFQSHYFDSNSDPDNRSSADLNDDELPHRVEYFLGDDPEMTNGGQRMKLIDGPEGKVARHVISLEPPSTGPRPELQYSFDLENWRSVEDSEDGGVTSKRNGSSWVVEIALGDHPRSFLRRVNP